MKAKGLLCKSKIFRCTVQFSRKEESGQLLKILM